MTYAPSGFDGSRNFKLEIIFQSRSIARASSDCRYTFDHKPGSVRRCEIISGGNKIYCEVQCLVTGRGEAEGYKCRIRWSK